MASSPLLSNPSLREIRAHYHALASITRLRILQHLAPIPEITVLELADAIGISHPRLSCRLRMLRHGQLVRTHRDAKPGASIPGLMHVELGGYYIRDIEFSAAFDIDKEKVGKDLADAIFAGHNNTVKFAEVPHLGVKVERGMTHDGLGKYLSEIITKAPGPTADIVGILKATRTDVVVNYLPVGSAEAVKWYAEQVLDAGCAFVNCMPGFLAREPYWRGRFEKRGVPIIGDDIKSQGGATIRPRGRTRLLEHRGV